MESEAEERFLLRMTQAVRQVVVSYYWRVTKPGYLAHRRGIWHKGNGGKSNAPGGIAAGCCTNGHA